MDSSITEKETSEAKQPTTLSQLKKKKKYVVLPRTGHEGPEGEYRYTSFLSFNLGVRWRWVVNVTPWPL
jgi:hypothetical protein